MPLTRIRELYVVELSEIYESEQEILRQLPLMASSAADSALREVFEAHYRATLRQVDRLMAIFDRLDERRRQVPVPAIRGLAEQARVRQALLERGELLDLALIDAGRRIEHYEMAAYSAALAYARRLGDADGATLILGTFDEEREMDERLEVLSALPLTASRVSAA
jgi:ferritin-like metal-binding protein YciE